MHDQPTEIPVYDVYDKETNGLLMSIQACSCEEAIERIGLTRDHVMRLRTPGGNIVVREHPPETLIVSPFYFTEAFFQLLEARSSARH